MRAAARFAGRAGGLLLAIAAIGLALISTRYLGGDPAVAPPEIMASAARNMPLFMAHAGGASLALLLLPFQLLLARKRRWRAAHAWLGRLYVAGVTLGGAAALPLALDSFGGPIAASGFTALGLAWLWCTWAGVAAARAGSHAGHGRWMVRSASLTLAAITLRLCLPLPNLLGGGYEHGIG